MQGGNACNAACSVIGGQRTRARTPAPVKRARVSSGAYCLHWSLFVPRTKQMGILGSYRPESAVSASLAWWKRVPARYEQFIGGYVPGWPAVRRSSRYERQAEGRKEPEGTRWIGQGLRCRSTKGRGGTRHFQLDN